MEYRTGVALNLWMLMSSIQCMQVGARLFGCPKDWTQAGQSCYAVFVYHDPENQDRSWNKARMNCMVLGADLVSINTDLEAYYLNIILKESGISAERFYWIGLTDSQKEGTFTWVDGSNVTYSRWQILEPTSLNPTNAKASEENYVVASGVKNWNDVINAWRASINGLSEPHAYVCEKVARLNSQAAVTEMNSTDLMNEYTGRTGATGATGATGLRGEPGEKGDKGDKGDTGSPGTRGETGAQGPPGSIPRQMLLNTVGAMVRAAPPGEPGSPGARGEQGVKGERGDAGIPGMDGLPGSMGATGEPGPTGSPGPTGPNGPPGFQGPVGPQGFQGLQGEKGSSGEKGSPGDQGLRGDTGTPGEPGEPGVDGKDGRDGVPGPPGEIGPAGSKGAQGDRGPAGFLGPRGLPGAPGNPGVNGARGLPGFRGSRGPQGLRGEKGGPGDMGLPGPPGPPGAPVQPRANLNATGSPGALRPTAADNAREATVTRDMVPNYPLPKEFIDTSVFCRGRSAGVFAHPLHCWQYVTCGAPYGNRELTCYSGRRFVPGTHECLPDKTCIYGAPSKKFTLMTEDGKPSSATVMAAKGNKNDTTLKNTLTLHSAAIILLFILISTLSIIVCKLLLTHKHRHRDRHNHSSGTAVTFPSVI